VCPILARFVRKGGIPRQRPSRDFAFDVDFDFAFDVDFDFAFCLCFWVAQRFTAAIASLLLNYGFSRCGQPSRSQATFLQASIRAVIFACGKVSFVTSPRPSHRMVES